MSVYEAENVSDLLQKLIISTCGEQKPGEVKFFYFTFQFI